MSSTGLEVLERPFSQSSTVAAMGVFLLNLTVSERRDDPRLPKGFSAFSCRNTA